MNTEDSRIVRGHRIATISMISVLCLVFGIAIAVGMTTSSFGWAIVAVLCSCLGVFLLCLLAIGLLGGKKAIGLMFGRTSSSQRNGGPLRLP